VARMETFSNRRLAIIIVLSNRKRQFLMQAQHPITKSEVLSSGN
jgi:hypothetical protein